MAQSSVLAKRYAEGLLRVARQNGELETVAAGLEAFGNLFQEGGQLEEIMLNPAYSSSQRMALLEELCPKLGLNATLSNFLKLLVKKRRIASFREILEAYGDLHRREIGVVRAEVTIAHAADEKTRERIHEVVARVTGLKPELVINQDPAIIGGIRIRMGNTVLDASIRTKLERLRETLGEPATVSGS